MRRVFVCEYLSGGGAVAGDAQAGELLQAGVAMRDAIVADLQALANVHVTCAVSARAAAPEGAWSRAAARPGEPFAAFVRRLAEAHDQAWIVAPETGGVLAALRDAVGAERWIGCGAHAIRVASRKRATLEALAAHGVPTPLDFAGVAARWVVKPDDGAGAADTRVHASRAAAEADLQARQRAARAPHSSLGWRARRSPCPCSPARRAPRRSRSTARTSTWTPTACSRGAACATTPSTRPAIRARRRCTRWRRRRTARCPGCAASWASTSSGTRRAGRWRSR